VATTAVATILIVDDERAIRELARRRLEEAGYRVLVAEDAPTGLAIAREEPRIDLLVADLVTPGMSGFEVAELVRALHRGIAVLYVTGWARATVADEEFGPRSALLTKPFPLDALVAEVEALLAS
jgi:two-component system cell cycle sensor histidine kinase/response regulator CckA